MKKKLVFSLVCTLLLTVCTSCGGASSVPADTDPTSSQTRDVFAMDTYMNLKAYGSNADAALSAAVDEIIALEDTLSVTKADSDISRVNSAQGTAVTVGDDASAIIAAAKKYGDLTGGALDITLYPVLRAWGFTTGEYRIPDADELANLLKNVDYSRVQQSGNEIQLPDDVMIDLGALAKGYTSDTIMDIMAKNGVTSAIVSLGGNVQALGSKPDGALWKVSVRNPFSPDTDMCILDIDDKAVITSGNYERYFTGEDGKVYWHILDPADGYPADNGIVSATIIGDSGLMCDALSTAMFAAGTEKAVDFWRSGAEDFEMILVTDDGTIMYTEGIAATFTNVTSMHAEVVNRD